MIIHIHRNSRILFLIICCTMYDHIRLQYLFSFFLFFYFFFFPFFFIFFCFFSFFVSKTVFLLFNLLFLMLCSVIK
jgi:hypothetical protein